MNCLSKVFPLSSFTAILAAGALGELPLGAPITAVFRLLYALALLSGKYWSHGITRREFFGHLKVPPPLSLLPPGHYKVTRSVYIGTYRLPKRKLIT